jgi:hypothetical protein
MGRFFCRLLNIDISLFANIRSSTYPFGRVQMKKPYVNFAFHTPTTPEEFRDIFCAFLVAEGNDRPRVYTPQRGQEGGAARFTVNGVAYNNIKLLTWADNTFVVGNHEDTTRQTNEIADAFRTYLDTRGIKYTVLE